MSVCKVIPQKFSQIICHNIDLEIDSLAKSNIVDNLVTEVLTIPIEKAIAYRHNFKWRQVITILSIATNNSLPWLPDTFIAVPESV